MSDDKRTDVDAQNREAYLLALSRLRGRETGRTS